MLSKSSMTDAINVITSPSAEKRHFLSPVSFVCHNYYSNATQFIWQWLKMALSIQEKIMYTQTIEYTHAHRHKIQLDTLCIFWLMALGAGGYMGRRLHQPPAVSEERPQPPSPVLSQTSSSLRRQFVDVCVRVCVCVCVCVFWGPCVCSVKKASSISTLGAKPQSQQKQKLTLNCKTLHVWISFLLKIVFLFLPGVKRALHRTCAALLVR